MTTGVADLRNRLLQIAVFVRAAERGSFTRTAQDLGLSQPSVSRLVSELEHRLGAQLLVRTTRRVVVTDAGRAFLLSARDILKQLEEAEASAHEGNSLIGTLRIAMPPAFGRREVIPALPAFLAAHPRLQVELTMSEQRQDLVQEGVDVAIRPGQLGDSGFGSRRLGEAPRLVVASPEYLQARGTPKTLQELSSHDCVFGPAGSSRDGWVFLDEGDLGSVAVDGRVRATSGEAVIACVKAGLGIAVASAWACRAELRSGELVSVLADYPLEPVEVHAVFPGGPHPPRKVRALVDHLQAALCLALTGDG